MAWASLGATAITAAGSYFGGKAANSANANLNQQTRDHQIAMRASQYQATVDDLIKAGLNPMLAYTNGSNPAPSVSAIPMQNELAGTADAVNSGVSAWRASTEREMSKAQIDKTNSETAVNGAMLAKVQADTIGSVNSAAYTAAGTKLVEVNVAKALAETQNIKDDNARILATINKLKEETKNLPLTGEQIKMATDLIGVQIKGGDIGNLQKSLDIPRMRAEHDMWNSSGGSIMPYFPKTIQGAAGGAKSVWDELTDYVRDKRSSSGFDRRVGNE